MNALAMNGDENSWCLYKSQRSKTVANKLCSGGYGYLIDKKMKDRVHWKCENKSCSGRGNSVTIMEPPFTKPPFTMTQAHLTWHTPVFE